MKQEWRVSLGWKWKLKVQGEGWGSQHQPTVVLNKAWSILDQEKPGLLFRLHSHAAVGGLPKILHSSKKMPPMLVLPGHFVSSIPRQTHTHTILCTICTFLSVAPIYRHTQMQSTSTAEWSQVGRPFIFHANGNLVRLPIDWAPLVSQTMPLQSAACGGRGGGKKGEAGRRWREKTGGGGRRRRTADSCSDWFKRWIKSRYVPPPLYWLMTVARAALDYASWFNHQPLI